MPYKAEFSFERYLCTSLYASKASLEKGICLSSGMYAPKTLPIKSNMPRVIHLISGWPRGALPMLPFAAMLKIKCILLKNCRFVNVS